MDDTTDKITQIMAKCKCCISIEINDHRNSYESAEQELEKIKALDEEMYDDIGEDVRKKMIETDTVVDIQVYPNTPIGFYRILHYDLETAIDGILEALG